MSLYQVQKLLFALNRDQQVQARYRQDLGALLAQYDLTEQESAAFVASDIGLLYVLGANGQLLMHYAAFLQVGWSDYLQRMRDGIAQHGGVRAGVYAMTSAIDERVAGV